MLNVPSYREWMYIILSLTEILNGFADYLKLNIGIILILMCGSELLYS